MSLNRRDLFRYGAASAAGWLAARAWLAAAIEPLQRVGGPMFKFSLAAYSYRDLLTGKKPELTLDDFIRACAELDLEGTELTSYYFPKELTSDYLLHLKQLCFQLGLDVSGTAVGNDFTLPPGEKRDRELASVAQWIEHAAVLGAPVIRIFSGPQRAEQSTDEARALAVAGIEESCALAGRHGIYLALENHGGLTETVEGTLALVEAVKSPWFGVNLDTGNYHGQDVYADVAQLAPYAVNVQVKVMVQPAGGKKRPTDYSRLATILRDANYRGYVVLEYEEPEDPRTACPRHMEDLRKALA